MHTYFSLQTFCEDDRVNTYFIYTFNLLRFKGGCTFFLKKKIYIFKNKMKNIFWKLKHAEYCKLLKS